jgi:two-component system response regulator HydG
MLNAKKILVVDDDATHRLMLEAVLESEGYEVCQADDGETAVEAVKKEFYDFILMDIRMARMSGIDALKEIKKTSPGIPVLIMTAYASVETAVDALKSGAYDYITKPLDTEKLKRIIAAELEHSDLKQEVAVLRERVGDRFDLSNIIGKSRKMKEVFEILAMAAPSDATVLIKGESGTGKELIANAIHQNSPRAGNPFIKVNCAALPESLLESELFGHERGAFTGAVSMRKGRFELANGGSIFLDEISEMSPAMQARLLRVLQEHEFDRVGGMKTIEVDVRVISATNKDLELEVKEGRFREDLFYRLNVISVPLPPLRERKEDIPVLAKHFLSVFSEKNRRMIKGFQPKTLDLFMRHDWPGNVRELENTIERCVIMTRSEYISPGDLPMNIQALNGDPEEDNTGVRPGWSMREVERDLIIKTLEQTDGNKTRAAEILGINRKTLQNKLKEYEVE